MRDNYDFSNSIKNPYSCHLKTKVTINLESDIVKYFQDIAEEKGMSYADLINLYLRDCVDNKRNLPKISFK